LISFVINYLLTTLLQLPGPENQALIEDMFKSDSVVILFFTIVIIAPITEEIIFRGIIQN